MRPPSASTLCSPVTNRLQSPGPRSEGAQSAYRLIDVVPAGRRAASGSRVGWGLVWIGLDSVSSAAMFECVIFPRTTLRAAGLVGLLGLVVAIGGAKPASASSTPTTVKTTGTRSVLVILMDWTAPDSVTPDSAKEIIGTDDNQFYDQASFGQLQWAPTVTPWLSVAAPSAPCGGPLISEGEAAAEQAGYDPDSYDNVMVYIPRDNSCISGAGGTSDDPGRTSIINGYMNELVTSHELGRTLGLQGADGLRCVDSTGGPVPLSASCTRANLNDPWDAMGAAPGFQAGSDPTIPATPQFSAPNADYMGWMTGREQTVTTSGTYTIEPLESQDTGLHALRIPLGRKVFWLEYRQPIGTDAFMSQQPCATNGVQIRMTDALQTPYPALLNMQATPSQPNQDPGMLGPSSHQDLD